MNQPPEELAGALAQRYRIERVIGVGGSATVYLARDLKHDREVALKVLRPALGAALAAQRFIEEIKITAQLEHPHILTLLDSGRVGSHWYYVLSYVRGGSLRDRLVREKQLGVEEAIAITLQVAGALDFAHRAGVLHRDIKPENILFHEGEAMLTDFGIALATEAAGERLTEEGGWLGTPHYMSLEQATGERELGPTADVYSLGAVLYEMLAGEPPYTGRTAQAVIAKRLVDPVPQVRRIRPTVRPAVEAAITRALALNPGDRFSSAAAFAAALQAPDSLGGETRAVAVLPFRSLGSDPENEVFADGITEDVIAHLAKIRALHVISRGSVMPFKEREQDIRTIAARLQASTVLDGSVRRSGERVRIVAQLVDPESGHDLWSETYDRELTDIFAIQTDVALRIANTLKATLTTDERTRIRKEPTNDLAAYRLYLQGRHWLLKFTDQAMRRGLDYFQQAISKDPDFALAHAGIAYAHLELGETGAEDPRLAYPAAEAAAHAALRLDAELGSAHCTMGYLRMLKDFDWAGAEAGLRRALELSPGDADIYDLYGRMCGAMRRFDEAIQHSQRAQNLDPLAHRTDLATQFLRAGRAHEGLEVARRSVEFEPDYPRAHAVLGWSLIGTGDVAAGMAELERTVVLAGRSPQWVGQLGQAHALHGDRGKAEALLAELIERSAQEFVSPYHLAYIHTGLGQHEVAIELLEKAIEERTGSAYGINGSFLFEPLRGHPQFQHLLRKLNLA